MNNFFVGTVSLLVSNILLSSYPILIKSYVSDISIIVQLVIRCIVYIFLSVPFMILGNEASNIFKTLIEPKYLFISLVNLVHIYSSYKGFEYLNPGLALTTFYTYPIIQMFLSEFLLGTKINPLVIFNLLGSVLGIAILNMENFNFGIFTNVKTSNNIDNRYKKIGYIAIIIAAITEALISVFYKKVDLPNPFTSLYTLYAPSFIIFFMYMVYKNRNEIKKIKVKKNILRNIILFNFLIGGIGYTLRLYAVTKINMSWFSSLAFTNGIGVFLLGWLFLGERIKWNHILGSSLIFYNIYRIKSLINGSVLV